VKLLPIFNLAAPTPLHGVDNRILDPRSSHPNAEQRQNKAENLSQLFIDNVVQYTDNVEGKALVAAVSRLD